MTEVNSLIRQLSIAMVTNNPNIILDWFNDLWVKIHVIETNVYHKNGGELIYYLDNETKKQYVFFRDDKCERFWCDYDHYWSFFNSIKSFTYIDIQNITKMLIDNTLDNSNISTPILWQNIYSPLADKVLNNII